MATPHKGENKKGERGWVLQTLLPPATLPYLSTFRVSLSRHLAVSSLAKIHTGRHPETWLSGITIVPGDLTTAAEFVLCVFFPYMTVPDRLFSGLSVL